MIKKNIVTYGEILLRLTPFNHGDLINQSSALNMSFAGAESNIISGLSNLGHNTTMITSLPKNSLGKSACRFLNSFGVNTDYITFKDGRIGSYYIEHGASTRGGKVIYDRLDSCFSSENIAESIWLKVFKDSNFWRLKYGFSFQWNKFDLKDNKFLVNTDGIISLEEFPAELDKAKFRTTNLVFPFHIEFGPSKKIDKKKFFRYSNYKKLRVGLGAYAGFNIGSMQKLKYKEDGNKIKDKKHRDFEVSDLVYGLSGYLGVGSSALYIKYDLSPVFKNQSKKQNNISVGLRIDLD